MEWFGYFGEFWFDVGNDLAEFDASGGFLLPGFSGILVNLVLLLFSACVWVGFANFGDFELLGGLILHLVVDLCFWSL